MFAAHLAAGLALKARVPKAPAWALLTGAFVPDLVWIGLARSGVEPTDPKVFFDDWSHSLATIIVWACLFAMPFWRWGRATCIAIWLAVFSHFVLDAPVHPKPLALFPNASMRVGWDTWHWGLSPSSLGASHYWWLQLMVTLVLLTAYVLWARRIAQPNLIAASCLLVIGMHLLML